MVTVSIWYLVGGALGIVYLLLLINRNTKVINLLIEGELFKEQALNTNFEGVSNDISKLNNRIERLEAQLEYIYDQDKTS